MPKYFQLSVLKYYINQPSGAIPLKVSEHFGY